MEKKIMLGNEAIARGAWEAGVKVSSAYPGTPSTEVSENLVKYEGVYAEWAPNEKVAAEVAMGASIIGSRAMCAMKCVGLNVASDPLYTASYIGANGGLVYIVADDPGLYSSQNEQDTRMIGRSAHVPVIEPADSEEARYFTKRAFEISEEYDTPVILRTTTRLAHSQGVVNCEDRVEIPDKEYSRNPQKNIMMPGNAKVRHVFVEAREERLMKDACTMDLNKVTYDDTKIGVITSGIPYQYVKEVLPHASVLKLGLVYPLPKDLIIEFASKVDTLYIVEELEPVIEEQVRSWGIECIGKEIFTKQGEYSANMLREKILHQEVVLDDPANVPNRPPILCPGCPHRSTFSVLKKLGIHASGDIGCYTLGAVAPLNVVETTLCMGGSISMLHGIEKAKGKDYVKNWVAVIGDSTFLHTGVNSLMNMAYNKATGTVIILDNSTTGMTGHQEHPATGKMLNGETTLCMGGSISMLHGIEKAKGKDYVKNWVAVIGDSTFLHTGVNSLMNMAYNKATGTVIILDNSTTGMTGHQEHPATGKMLNGETTYAIDLEKLCRAIGIEDVFVIDAFDLKLMEKTIKEEVAKDTLSVIIAQSPCALLKSYVPKGKCVVDPEKCKKCGLCLKPGCPAIKKDEETGVTVIDDTLCNGCGLCQQLCPFGAIELKKKGE